jgi:hypothetical protein
MTGYDVKKTVSALFLDILGGDVHIRQQFLNVLISYIVTYIKKEKLEPNQSSVVRFRTSLHNTIYTVMRNTHPLPLADAKRENEIKKLVDYFDKFVIKIDEHVADHKGVEQIGIIEDIESLEYARNLCYSAAADYSDSLAGKPEGLTNLSIKQAMIIDALIPIMDNYHLIDFSEADYTRAVSMAANRAESRAKESAAKREIQI